MLDFHRTFAGHEVDVPGESGPLGIIHREVGSQSWYRPMKVAGYPAAKNPLLACADVHMSWEMMTQLDGTIHCNGPEASSFFLWTERSAFIWEFALTHRLQRFVPAEGPDELNDRLLPRLACHRFE